MRIVVALGGNALLRRGEPLEAYVQRAHIEDAARSVAAIAHGNEVIITHGNGPQVGLLALQAEGYWDVQPYPLDVLGAETAGMIGYLLQQAIGNHIPDRDVVTVVTEVMVDYEDAALTAPSKPIGPVYPVEVAWSLANERGWHVGRDGAGYRRLVPSPEPREIVQIEAIMRLAAAGAVVICAGGGGVPSMLDCKSGKRLGIEAVIDKDLTAALLAIEAQADLLMLLTDVDAVYRDWGTEHALPIRYATTRQLRAMTFAPGSMAPKVEAGCRFVEATGRPTVIGALDSAHAVLGGLSGCWIRAESEAAESNGRSGVGRLALRAG